jgi:hypothetical protein
MIATLFLFFSFILTTPDGLLQVTVESATMAECQQKRDETITKVEGRGYSITPCVDSRFEIPKAVL